MAGFFYPSDKDELFETIHWSFTSSLGPGTFPSKNANLPPIPSKQENIPCFVVPHAGYVYSGPIAAHSYSRVFEFLSTTSPKTVVAFILGPNHYGIGSGLALSPSKSWETPLGEVKVNESATKRLEQKSEILDIDETTHSREHSIEVQLPFLQVVSKIAGKELSIVPICMMLQDRESAEQVSKALLSQIKEMTGRETVLLIGSSDLTHYEPQKQANTKDAKLLSCVSNLNILEFYNVLERQNVSACGYGAIATLMYVAKGLEMKKANLLKYATSGDSTGDKSSVVGYSAVQFT